MAAWGREVTTVMEMVAGYVKSLAIFMVFISVCSIIMPEGRFKGVLSFITGIMLMLVILKPVNAVFNSDAAQWVEKGIKLNTYTADNEIQQYGQDSVDMIIDSFETACEDMLETELGAERIVVNAKNGADGVYIDNIEVYSRDNSDAQRAASLCGIDSTRVRVINSGAGEYNEANQ